MPADKIIQSEFDGYIKAVYHDLPPESEQYEHLRGAFFGGAVVALNRAEGGHPCHRDEAIAAMDLELEAFGREAPIAKRVLSGEMN
jgi:hypothetical protein